MDQQFMCKLSFIANKENNKLEIVHEKLLLVRRLQRMSTILRVLICAIGC
jgi:hypothetical protein